MSAEQRQPAVDVCTKPVSCDPLVRLILPEVRMIASTIAV